MADRTFYPSQSFGLTNVYLEFFFLTNGTSQPALSSVTGVGQPDVVASLNRTGVGVIVVTLGARCNFNKVCYATADVDDTPNDGAYATIKSITGEGSGLTTPIGFTLTTRAAGGVATDFGTGGTGAARRCYVCMRFRQTAAGMQGS